MNELRSSLFFNLESFSHRDIFSETTHVWETLKNLKEYLDSYSYDGIHCSVPQGTYLVHRDKIQIGEGTILDPGVYIEGPCVIGRDCHVRQGAYMRPYSLIGDRCVIGHATEVKHSIFLDDANAPHFNFVGDSILGNHVNLGAGVTCANFRVDRKDVVVRISDKMWKTGLRKFGAIIGDRSQLGCHTVVNPGVLLKKKTLTRAGAIIQQSNLKLEG